MSFSGRKFSINRHTGEPKPKVLTRRFSTTEPSMNGTFYVSPRPGLVSWLLWFVLDSETLPWAVSPLLCLYIQAP